MVGGEQPALFITVRQPQLDTDGQEVKSRKVLYTDFSCEQNAYEKKEKKFQNDNLSFRV